MFGTFSPWQLLGRNPMGTQAAPVSEFDYIVVGAGSAGCVVANRLSEHAENKVLLLEAGPPDTDPNIHDPLALSKVIGSALDWKYMTEKQPFLNGRQIMSNRGKVLGGSSSINAMIYVRGNRRDYDHWNFLGNEGWAYQDVLPYFKKSERYELGESHYHGGHGHLSVINNHNPTDVARAFMDGAVELDYDGPDWDFNGARQENGAGLYQYTITPEHKRCATSVAFLDTVRSRKNLTILTGAQATRVLVQSGAATGIEYAQNGTTQKAMAAKEIILSAGVYASPQLLMLSGIGPAEHLKAMGIPVQADLPGVGQNLHDHLVTATVFQLKQPVSNPATIAEAGLFVRTKSGVSKRPPDLQYHFQAGVTDYTDPNFKLDPTKVVFAGVMIKPYSRGQVTLRSSNPFDPPVIDPRYLQTDAEMQTLIQSIVLARELANTSAMSKLIAAEIFPSQAFPDLSQYIRNSVQTLWHPVGTCKMGLDPQSVVDPRLRIYGVDHLRVADASIMPTITSGNTNAACIMIGEKAADMIRGPEETRRKRWQTSSAEQANGQASASGPSAQAAHPPSP
ncbi:MAG TPA: GMC family oxidoreductase N-terminal domain-containing protein [Candidatus Angelobacter sp.]